MKVPDLPAGRPNLVLVGFMGTGKTTVGKLAAARLGMPFLDLDEVLAVRSGMAIPALLEALGEAEFRRREQAMMGQAALLSGAVVATGGGAVLSPDAFSVLLARSVAFVLTASTEAIIERLAGSTRRPLLPDLDRSSVEGLLRSREAAYGESGRPVDTTGRSAEDVAEEVVLRYRGGSPSISSTVDLAIGAEATQVVIGAGAAGGLGDRVRRERSSVRRAFMVVDEGVATSAGPVLGASLRSAGIEVFERVVWAGEAAKSLESVTGTWRWLLSLEADRQDVVVAVGGGAVLDAAGFAAATFARGLPLINVPTTLLAMADAAVGGKVAINLDGVKNPVGAFHHATLVVADPLLLGNLSDPVAGSGVAEVVKSGLIGSPLAVDLLRQSGLRGGDPDWVAWLVEQAVRVKVAYVSTDPTDQGQRLALNLGHTFAHGLESAADYRLSHGHAVGIGLLAAAGLGARLGLSPPPLKSEVEATLKSLSLPSTIPVDLSRARVLGAMRRDKKRRSGSPVFVVPAPHLGVFLVEDVDLEVAMEELWALEGDGPDQVGRLLTPAGGQRP